MPDIVITEFMDELAVSSLARDFDVAYDPDLCDHDADLVRIAPMARALIVRNRTQVRGDLLMAATRLECVGRLGVGLDNIDVGACSARGVAVYPASGANDLAVAEYVIASALLLLRGSFGATESVISGRWPRQDSVGMELAGKTMGLVGFGAIARQVASRARALGMACIGHDPLVPLSDPAWNGVASVSLADLLQASHVVSLHVPLNAGTHHLINADALALMRRDALLVNTARGGVVDETALVAALHARRLGGAALDVFEVEPLDAASGSRFHGLSNLLLTPHIAGVTTESNRRVSELIASRVRGHLQGTR